MSMYEKVRSPSQNLISQTRLERSPMGAMQPEASKQSMRTLPFCQPRQSTSLPTFLPKFFRDIECLPVN